MDSRWDEQIRRLLDLKKTSQDWQPTSEPPTFYQRELRVCEPPEIPPPVGSLEEARTVIRDGMIPYLDEPFPTELLLVKALPGVGKTTAAVEIVDTLPRSGLRIAYAGPRHDLYVDIIAKSGDPRLWDAWLPRQAEDKDNGKMQTCVWPGQIDTWLKKGYKGIDFCSGVCGWDYIKNDCVYYAQQKRTEPVIYVQHQHIAIKHPLKFDVIFGDESPLSAFTHEWKIPAAHI